MSELKVASCFEFEKVLSGKSNKLFYSKAEADNVIAELEERIAELERMDTEHTLQIAKMNGYISHLEEERRWRKCREGLPLEKQRVLFLARYKNNVREWIGEFRHNYGMEDFACFYASSPGWGCEFLIDEVIGWMPLPSAPKD